MLTLFIAKSHARGADAEKAAASFGDLPSKVFHVEHNEVNGESVFTPWYAVLYDDEVLDEGTAGILRNMCRCSQADVIVMFKNNNTKAPRLFRNWIRLQYGSLLPSNPNVKFEYAMNGMIKPQLEQ